MLVGLLGIILFYRIYGPTREEKVLYKSFLLWSVSILLRSGSLRKKHNLDANASALTVSMGIAFSDMLWKC